MPTIKFDSRIKHGNYLYVVKEIREEKAVAFPIDAHQTTIAFHPETLEVISKVKTGYVEPVEIDITLTDIDHDPLHFAMTAFTTKGKQSMWNKFGNGAVEAVIPLQNLEQVKAVLRDEGLEVENRVAEVRHITAELSMCETFSVGGRMFLSLPQNISVPWENLKEIPHGDESYYEYFEKFSNTYGCSLKFTIFND